VSSSSLAIRVIYGDTDQMGVVYYANYLRWFEASRGHFIRERGGSYREFEALGYALPVAEAYVKYRRPAKYDDVIEVTPTLAEVGHASMKFTYRVTRGADLLAEGWTLHACIDRNGRPARFPEEVKRLLGDAAGI
jgi:acyl-CoA thioester hydrolase